MQEPSFTLNGKPNVLETPSFAQIDPFVIPTDSQGLFSLPMAFECPQTLADNGSFQIPGLSKREHAMSFNPSYLSQPEAAISIELPNLNVQPETLQPT